MPFGEEFWWGGAQVAPHNTGRSLYVGDNTTWLQRTNSAAAPTDPNKMTFSAWYRQTALGATICSMFWGGTGNHHSVEVNPANGCVSNWKSNVGRVWSCKPDGFDPAEWVHAVVSFDGTQAAGPARWKVFLNRVEQTEWSVVPTVANSDCNWNAANGVAGIGRHTATYGWRGYLHYPVLVDGLLLTPDSFGYRNANGKWTPKQYVGSVGVHGFILDFANTLNPGQDLAGNGDFALNGITGDNFYEDTPHKTYPLIALPGDYPAGTIDVTRLNTNPGATGTFQMVFTHTIRAGKWYWEIKVGSAQATNTAYRLGLVEARPLARSPSPVIVGITGNGQYYDGSALSAYGPAPLAGESIGVEADMDAHTIRFFMGGAWQALKPLDASIPLWSPITMYQGLAAQRFTANFGQFPPFVNTMPSDCKELHSANQEAYFDPTQYVGILQYTGNGGAQGVGGLNFTPDMVWIRHRNTNEPHVICDSVRGVGHHFIQNSTAADVADATVLTGFNAGGISLGASLLVNKVNDPYVAYCWKRAPAAGFDIVTWVGDGAAAKAIPHALGKVPAVVIVKRRDGVTNWPVGGPEYLLQNYVLFNTTANIAASATIFPTLPDANNINVGSDPLVNALGGNYIAYVFTEIRGLSYFSSYTATGAQNFPIICGLRAGIVVQKQSLLATWWRIFDHKRQGTGGTTIFDPMTVPVVEPAAGDAIAESYANGCMPGATSGAAKLFVWIWAAALHKLSRATPPGGLI